jgi:hypothetical protein
MGALEEEKNRFVNSMNEGQMEMEQIRSMNDLLKQENREN